MHVEQLVGALPGPEQRGFLGASSDWSWQSKSPSHSHELRMRQRPLAQRNSLGPHVGYSAKRKDISEEGAWNERRNEGKRLELVVVYFFLVFQQKLAAHHTPGTRRSHRCSRGHGRTQSAWGCTVDSGT